MNRTALRNSAPTAEGFSSLSRAHQQQQVSNLIEATLSAIEQEQRQPDAWEAMHISAALGAYGARWTHYAMTCAIKALAEPDDREEPSPTGITPSLVDLRSLHQAVVNTPL